MLNAISKGKGGRVPEGISEDDSLREVFKASEDMLTAAVFERLGYLSGRTLWRILGSTFGSTNFPDRRVVNLDAIEFWPRWTKGSDGPTIEPDVVLRLSVGDPGRKVDIIFECKLNTDHYAQQLIDEWRAYTPQDEDEDEPAEEIWLLCIGGSLEKAEKSIAELKEAARDRGSDVKAAAATWKKMLAAIGPGAADFDSERRKPRKHALEPRGSVAVDSDNERRILEDMREALRLHGYRQFRPMSELCEATKHRQVRPETMTKTMETLRRGKPERPPA